MRVEEERMKESWIDKLIELLNEHSKENKRPADFEEYFDSHFLWGEQEHWFKWSVDESVILSKRYGFIKRLADNDKIAYRRCLDLWYEIAVIDEEGEDVDVMRTFDSYEQLLMYLAIQDKPIEFLISLLY